MKDFNDIKPSAEQEGCISYSSGDLLVNGVPGAGKSIVLLKRALEFYKASERGEKNVVLLTTFNNTLNDYTTEVFQQVNIDSNKMTIMTMDKYCCKVYFRLFGKFYLVNEKERIQYVSKALQNHFAKTGKDHRFYHVDDYYWCEEFTWIKQKNIRTLQEYLEAERTGRGGGVRITREERRIVFELFQEYCAEMKVHRKTDLEDIYMRLIDAGARLTPYKYKYVLVDEAQDLSFVKLRVAKLLASNSITIAADKAQKIYNTGFTWKELGIDVRGNASKTLHKTFRSTKQIVQLAESLSEINRYRDGDKGEYTDPILPTILGEDYPFVIQCTSLTDENQFLVSLVSELITTPVTMGLLYRNYSEKQNIINMLHSKDINYQEIKKRTDWSLKTPGVKLVTLHSSKGLEFDIVIIPYFNDIYYPLQADIEKAEKEQVEEIKAKERNLLYVGMTRAKSALYFTFSGSASLFLSEFNPNYYNYVSSSGTELEKPQRSFFPQRASRYAIQQEDTIIAHCEGDATLKTFCGKGIKNWIFLGKSVGDRVSRMGKTYIIDEIKGKSTLVRPSNEEEWKIKKKLISSKCYPYIDILISSGVSVPTTVGSELMGSDGDIIAKAELAWENEKTVFLRSDQCDFKKIWEEKGWRVLTEETPITSIRL